MIASLMMYARPELHEAHLRYWALIRSELATRGVKSPATLSNDADAMALWQDPALVLSQTCGMPYRTALHGKVALIGTADFGLQGCPPAHYNSPIVVRADDPRTTLSAYAKARLAYNGSGSQSGFASIYNTVKPLGFWFDNRVISGGHQASAQMVADGQADIAALDGVTWALIQRYDAFARKLRVLEWTAPTPGLPYIASQSADAPATFAAIQSAIKGLSDDDRDALMLRALVSIPAKDYLAVPNPPIADGVPA